MTDQANLAEPLNDHRQNGPVPAAVIAWLARERSDLDEASLYGRLQDETDTDAGVKAARRFLAGEAARRALLDLLTAGRWRRRLAVADDTDGLAAEYWRAHGLAVEAIPEPWREWRPSGPIDVVLLPEGFRMEQAWAQRLAAALPELGVVVAPPNNGAALGQAGILPGEPLTPALTVFRKLRPIHLVVPVYGAVDMLERAVAALRLYGTGLYASAVVIDDATPDPLAAERIRALAETLPGAQLVVHAENRGFPATANEGMRLAPPGSDVVLLNSDAVVTPHWLVKMAEAAWSRPAVATVTPLSNEAADLSIPCAAALADACNAFLEGRLASGLPHYPAVPTGVGFCWYLRREALDAVGMLDEAFGLGYGEEVDFCRRAAALGFVHVLDDRTFVYHYGHRSMEEHGVAHDEEEKRRTEELRRRYPDLAPSVDQFLASGFMGQINSEWGARLRVFRPKTKPRLWIQLWHSPHHEAGGVEVAARDSVDLLSPLYECLVSWTDAAHVFLEEPGASLRERNLPRSAWPLEAAAWDGGRLRRTPKLVADWADLLGRYRVDVVYAMHPLGAAPVVMEAAAQRHIPVILHVYDFALLCPDYNLLGPSGHHCGAPDDLALCRTCLAGKTNLVWDRAPLDGDLSRWRSESARQLKFVDRVVYPSTATQQLVESVLGASRGCVMPMWREARAPRPAGANPPPRLVALGYRGPQKGDRMLVSLVPALVEDGFSVYFLGTDAEDWPELQNLAGVSFGGRYLARDAVDKLRAVDALAVLLPSAFAETFSLTLSEAWLAGLPAIVAPFGAPADRVRATGAGVVAREYTVDAFRAAARTVRDQSGPLRQAAFAAAGTLLTRLGGAGQMARLLGEVTRPHEGVEASRA